MGDPTLPYAPSVFDRLFHWMAERPERRWLYAVVYVVSVGILLAAAAIDGRLNEASTVPYVLVNGLWAIFIYASIDFVDREVVRASKGFRDVFERGEDEYRVEVFGLSTMPARVAALVWGVGFAAFFALSVMSPAVSDADSIAARMVVAPVIAFSYASGPLFIYHTVRLLTGVSRLLKRGRVNVFHLTPLYGFSRVTARVGVVYLVASALNAISEAALELSTEVTTELLIGVVITSVAAVASFVSPLIGTHARIRDAKAAALSENSDHIERLRSRMYAELDSENHGAFKGLDDALDGLLRMGDTLRAIPTWPWSAGTFRGFFTAIGVPVAIFVIQRALDTFL